MHVSAEQAPFDVYNSPLSEAGVLGFEYGYSLESPDVLVLWEAQFGDFCNAAQVIIDQFIVSAEDKWKQFSGITLLLPHGFEGMGPEHSSARIERWLLLAAEENIQICQPSTPAQFFHLLRRQALRSWRKPLIVFTPKSLLRHPKATSDLGELSPRPLSKNFAGHALPHVRDPRGVRRVLLCSGKVYYTLEQRREELNRRDVAIVRVEQFYPLPDEHLRAALDPFPEAARRMASGGTGKYGRMAASAGSFWHPVVCAPPPVLHCPCGIGEPRHGFGEQPSARRRRIPREGLFPVSPGPNHDYLKI